MSFLRKSQLYFIFSFFALIIIGALLLWSPLVTNNGQSINFVDAVFTATSAVCVTGLTTVNTSGFNHFGQIIILMLIQLGAIGIMSLTSTIIFFVRQEMSISDKALMASASGGFPVKELKKLMIIVFLYTAAIEIAGIFILTIGFWGMTDNNIFQALYLATFHSISAFCNAGFSTFDDSLMRVNPLVKHTIGLLIILGGLGIYVIYDIWQFLRHRVRFRIYSRIVIGTTLFLIFGGAIAIKFMEWASEKYISFGDALFQSVTARTAGFNSVDITAFSAPTTIIMVILMIIGASPGSTGGGMKTTTAALVFLSIYNIFKGKTNVVVFKRTIPMPNILKAFTICFTFIGLTVIGATLLSFGGDFTLKDVVFEVVSALGTVGLSEGVTSRCSIYGKMILIIFMFLGRIGPFTFFLFLLSKEKDSNLRYPEEKIILG
ncbi:potassium transporter TrkG [Lentisphaerota bacterium WC36G]|nr:potassium transporter [Lentisphaerae bacterium WC36]